MRRALVLSLIAGCGADPVPSAGDAAGGDAGPADGASAADARPADAAVGSFDAGQPDAWARPAYCDDIPLGPFPSTVVLDSAFSEDIDFDDYGHVYESDGQHLYLTEYDGTREIFAAAVAPIAGRRRLSTGELVASVVYDGAVARFDSDGTRTNLVLGLDFPNGIEIDDEDIAYVAEFGGDRVFRVDPFTGDYTVLLDGEIDAPDGLSFSPDYKHLYIGGYSGLGIVYRLEVKDDGTAGELMEWKTSVGTGFFDGMGVDGCGNVYVSDYHAQQLLRVWWDASFHEVVLHGAGAISTLQWGRNFGDFADKYLYVTDFSAGLLEVAAGVKSKPRP